jgi:DNA polymerase-4
MTAAVLCVDMDAFYASVELRRRPELAGRPVIVGGGGPRGVVLSATYDARERGVRAGQAVSRARRLCPEAALLPPDHDEYALASGGVMELLHALVRRVEPASLDEAYLDLAGVRTPPRALAGLIRERVAAEQQLGCSVGIGPNKLIAKLAATSAKPGGIREVGAAEAGAFLRPLPARSLPGIGTQTEELLDRYGLRTVEDLAATPRETLRRMLGASTGDRLHRFAHGVDDRPFVPHRAERSIGAERTFPADTDDPDAIDRMLLALSREATARLRAAGLAARTVTLAVKLNAPRTREGSRRLSRSRTLPAPTGLSGEVYATASELFRRLGLTRPRVRLLGVRLENLGPEAPEQLSLEAVDRGGPREIEAAVDDLVRRFGPAAVRPASLLPGPGARARRGES